LSDCFVEEVAADVQRGTRRDRFEQRDNVIDRPMAQAEGPQNYAKSSVDAESEGLSSEPRSRVVTKQDAAAVPGNRDCFTLPWS
jgi:hypothetical protein